MISRLLISTAIVFMMVFSIAGLGAQDLYQSFGGVSIYRTVTRDTSGINIGETYTAYNTNNHVVCLGFWVTDGFNYTSTLVGRGPLLIGADAEARLGTIRETDSGKGARWETWLEVGTDCY